MEQYNKINKNSLKGEILIESRNTYIELLSKDFLINRIIPIEYIDNKINLNNINKSKIDKDYIIHEINDIQRLHFIHDLLIKECIRGTSKLITTMCS